jgi:hypothetical protein
VSDSGRKSKILRESTRRKIYPLKITKNISVLHAQTRLDVSIENIERENQMNVSKKALLASAVAGLFAGASMVSVASANHDHKDCKKGEKDCKHCGGENGCGGKAKDGKKAAPTTEAEKK